jgi:hypothetical protein
VTDLENPTLHYYFTNTILKNLVLEQYEYYKQLIGSGPIVFNESLRQNWNVLAKRTDVFGDTEEIVSDEIFAFDVIEQDNAPLVFLIFLPKAQVASESYIIATILYNNNARMFLLEKSDLHLTLKAAGAPPELCKPFFMIGELTNSGHVDVGRIQTAEGFVDAVMAVARGEEI